MKIRTIGGRRKEKSKPPVHGEEMLLMQQRSASNGKRNDTELTTRDFDDHQNGSIQNGHAQNRLMLNGSTTNRKLGSRRNRQLPLLYFRQFVTIYCNIRLTSAFTRI